MSFLETTEQHLVEFAPKLGLANQVMALRHICAQFPRKVTIHAGAIPITARGNLSYDYSTGMFTLIMPEKIRGEFSPNLITQIDGSDIWVD